MSELVFLSREDKDFLTKKEMRGYVLFLESTNKKLQAKCGVMSEVVEAAKLIDEDYWKYVFEDEAKDRLKEALNALENKNGNVK